MTISVHPEVKRLNNSDIYDKSLIRSNKAENTSTAIRAPFSRPK